MRFDGLLGFAGGIVDNPMHFGSDSEAYRTEVIEALKRELSEELLMDDKITARISKENYLFDTEFDANGRTQFLHFYALEV